MSYARYALYLTPPQDSDLWRFGCDVIGRDAWAGKSVAGFAPQDQTLEAWRELTSEPRRYGFHATLKAPFRLRADLDFFDLTDAAAGLARKLRPFDAGRLQVGCMPAAEGRAFVVLKPEGSAIELRSMAERVVRDLDPMRAPLTDAERGRWVVGRLTPRQRYYLDAWGYPYVIDEFQPHFTLTDPIEDAGGVAKALAGEFRLRVASPVLRVGSVALFGERRSDGVFEALRIFPLGQAKRAKRSSRAASGAFID